VLKLPQQSNSRFILLWHASTGPLIQSSPLTDDLAHESLRHALLRHNAPLLLLKCFQPQVPTPPPAVFLPVRVRDAKQHATSNTKVSPSASDAAARHATDQHQQQGLHQLDARQEDSGGGGGDGDNDDGNNTSVRSDDTTDEAQQDEGSAALLVSSAVPPSLNERIDWWYESIGFF
jgi:hypothetical protein